MIEKADAKRTVLNKTCGFAVMGGWRKIIEGPWFRTDSDV